MESDLAVRVIEMRVNKGIKETRPGQTIRGKYCKVFFFKTPDFAFTGDYMLGVTTYSGNWTYTIDMSDKNINVFFERDFKDEAEFLNKIENYGFLLVGNDI